MLNQCSLYYCSSLYTALTSPQVESLQVDSPTPHGETESTPLETLEQEENGIDDEEDSKDDQDSGTEEVMDTVFGHEHSDSEAETDTISTTMEFFFWQFLYTRT